MRPGHGGAFGHKREFTEMDFLDLVNPRRAALLNTSRIPVLPFLF